MAATKKAKGASEKRGDTEPAGSRAQSSTLTLRGLNRATLARQALLAREKSAARVIERVMGLQAQWPKPPFLGLWSRVAHFERDDLLSLVRSKKVVRATMMRGTLHFVGAKDYLALRPAIQPVLTKGMRSVLRDRIADLDLDGLVGEARAFFLAQPRTFGELRDHLMKLHPKGDERAMGFVARMSLPLVQVPTGPGEDAWGYPADSAFAHAEAWLGAASSGTIEPSDAPDELVLRYLAAFGPATVGDAQAWSGLQGLAAVFERLRPKLTRFLDERKREQFDLPAAPRPSEDTPAPVRLLPEFDNLIVSRADARFVPLAHRKKVFLSALRVRATFLVDGFAAGTWGIAKKAGTATVTLEPFAVLPQKAIAELEKEAEALTKFVEPEAKKVEVKIAKA
jgi:hypothetical protein